MKIKKNIKKKAKMMIVNALLDLDNDQFDDTLCNLAEVLVMYMEKKSISRLGVDTHGSNGAVYSFGICKMDNVRSFINR